MRCAVRFVIGSSIILLTVLFFVKERLEDLWVQNNIPGYLRGSIHESLHDVESNDTALWEGDVDDKVIVMAKLEHENVDWVYEDLPE